MPFRSMAIDREGASALPAILIMTSIIMEVVVAGLVVSKLASNDLAREQASLEALEIAESGAHDAIIRVSRYLDCPNSTYCPATFALPVGLRSACVNIIETVDGQEIIIYSRGTVRKIEKYIKVVLGINPAELTTNVKILKEVVDPANDGDEETNFTECQ